MADIIQIAEQLNSEVTRLNNERSKMEGMLESAKTNYEKTRGKIKKTPEEGEENQEAGRSPFCALRMILRRSRARASTSLQKKQRQMMKVSVQQRLSPCSNEAQERTSIMSLSENLAWKSLSCLRALARQSAMQSRRSHLHRCFTGIYLSFFCVRIKRITTVEKKRGVHHEAHTRMRIFSLVAPPPLTNSIQMQEVIERGRRRERQSRLSVALAQRSIAFECFGLSRVRCAGSPETKVLTRAQKGMVSMLLVGRVAEISGVQRLREPVSWLHEKQRHCNAFLPRVSWPDRQQRSGPTCRQTLLR